MKDILIDKIENNRRIIKTSVSQTELKERIEHSDITIMSCSKYTMHITLVLRGKYNSVDFLTPVNISNNAAQAESKLVIPEYEKQPNLREITGRNYILEKKHCAEAVKQLL